MFDGTQMSKPTSVVSVTEKDIIELHALEL